MRHGDDGFLGSATGGQTLVLACEISVLGAAGCVCSFVILGVRPSGSARVSDLISKRARWAPSFPPATASVRPVLSKRLSNLRPPRLAATRASDTKNDPAERGRLQSDWPTFRLDRKGMIDLLTDDQVRGALLLTNYGIENVAGWRLRRRVAS